MSGASIAVEGLSFAFRGGSRCLEDVSLEVGRGEVCCLLGSNGAGKTTLMRCLLGHLRPSAGRVRIMGQDTAAVSPRQLARLAAYMPQFTSTAFPFTALEMVVMGRTPHLGFAAVPSRADRRAARAMLDRLGIGALGGRPFSQLSGGERQLVMLARALVQEVEVLVLDEPTASLDFGNEARILQTVVELAGHGPTVLLSTHQPNHALSWADRAVLMRQGAVIGSGPPWEVLTSEALSDLYGIPVLVTQAGDRRVCFAAGGPAERADGAGRLPKPPAPPAAAVCTSNELEESWFQDPSR